MKQSQSICVCDSVYDKRARCNHKTGSCANETESDKLESELQVCISVLILQAIQIASYSYQIRLVGSSARLKHCVHRVAKRRRNANRFAERLLLADAALSRHLVSDRLASCNTVLAATTIRFHVEIYY